MKMRIKNMEKKLTKEVEIKFARKFFDTLLDTVEEQDDTIYEFIDPECKYGSELCKHINNETIKEVVALGFRAKYGVDWHKAQEGGAE